MGRLLLIIWNVQVVFVFFGVTLFIVECLLEKENYGLAPLLPIMWGLILPILGYAIAFAFIHDSIKNIRNYRKEKPAKRNNNRPTCGG